MEPGVPFALLGGVQLLLVAAWCALAGTAVALRRSRLAALLVVLGALLLAAVEVRTALRFGQIRSDDLAIGRAAGALLLAAGIGSGALRDRVEARVPPELLGIIVPLASAPGPAFLAGACTAIAALVAARARRDLAGTLLAVGLGAAAVAAVAAPLADDNGSGSIVVIALRGAAAVALLAGLVALARVSLLGKVVAAILAGVLAMAAAALGVVGTNVVSSYQKQANALTEEGTFDRLAALDRLGESAQVVARLVADPALCSTPTRCKDALNTLVSGGETSDFVVRVTKTGQARSLGGRAPLSGTELLGVSRDPDVRELFTTAVGINAQPIVKLRLVGPSPVLAVAAASVNNPKAPTYAVLYGVRIDDDYAASDIAAETYGLSFLVEGGTGMKVVASNLPKSERDTVQQIADDAGIAQGLDADGVTTTAEGSRPTVHFAPVVDNADLPLGVIAVSREASQSLAAQRSALTSLFITALLATALVGGLALLLGRRTVDPVRRLTAAAARVSAGDLQATAAVASADEVGTLSRTFDTMTASLAQLTGDLRSSAARLETVLSSMSDGLVATDAHGRVTSINPAALQMVGLETEQEAVGRPIADVVDVRDVSGSALAVPTLRLFDAAGEVHRAADDDTVPVRVSLAPLATGDGVVLVLRDTTREREVERMKTEFLSNVSHELRTPLTPIRGYAEMLVAKPDSDAKKIAMFAGTIRDESLRMGRVVDLLVDVAAIEAGRVTVTPRPVSVKSLVDGRLEVWKTKAPERTKDFKKRVAAGLPAVMVDPEWVGKALDELVDNAVKYTPVGTPITLTAALLEDTVRVGVRDAGPGIAETDQRTMFTSFEQVDGSATRRVGGLGLGLSFVRRLADDAGFPLSFTSTVGKGSEFSLDLPISEEPVPTARRASPAKRRPAPARGRAR